jgi:hypothetical protein
VKRLVKYFNTPPSRGSMIFTFLVITMLNWHFFADRQRVETTEDHIEDLELHIRNLEKAISE